MATIKSYTDLGQSQALAEILPIESADYHYIVQGEKSYFYSYSLSSDAIKDYDEEIKYIPCWSLAALLKLLPKSAQLKKGNVTELYRVTLPVELKTSNWYIDPIDACYEFTLKLHELNLL